eukprot:scaffold17768_cov56-Isochrysis_galbana.AAC.2
MTQESGKPVKPATVCNHIFTAVTAGWPMQLQAVAEMMPAPTQTEWEAMERAEAALGLDIQ